MLQQLYQIHALSTLRKCVRVLDMGAETERQATYCNLAALYIVNRRWKMKTLCSGVPENNF